MATKGASNHYGNSRGGIKGHKTNHTGFAWAKDFNKRTLKQHFEDHGAQMKASTKDAYIAHAIKFANTIDRKNNISFIDKRGSTYKYNKETNELCIVTKKGYVVTYYKPKEGYSYYLNQLKTKGRKK